MGWLDKTADAIDDALNVPITTEPRWLDGRSDD